MSEKLTMYRLYISEEKGAQKILLDRDPEELSSLILFQSHFQRRVRQKTMGKLKSSKLLCNVENSQNERQNEVVQHIHHQLLFIPFCLAHLVAKNLKAATLFSPSPKRESLHSCRF